MYRLYRHMLVPILVHAMSTTLAALPIEKGIPLQNSLTYVPYKALGSL